MDKRLHGLLRKANVEKITRKMRRSFSTQSPLVSGIDKKLPTYTEVAPAVVNGKAGKRILVVFRTPPCERNCTMCGYRNESVPEVSNEDLNAQLVSALDSTLSKIDENTPIRLSLCTSSSTFNRRIPFSFWEDAMRMINQHPNILDVDIEARADEIPANIDRLKNLRRILSPDKQLLVGMGLETLDGFIRNNILGKGMSLETFENAVYSLGNAGVGAFAYVLLKPPGLNEHDAIDECAKTIEYFFDLARKARLPSSRITLKPLFITKNTVLEQLYSEDLASPPKLWSLLEVLKRVNHLGHIFSPLTDENLSDGRTAKNCPECTPRTRQAVREFNRTGDANSLDVDPCECKEKE